MSIQEHRGSHLVARSSKAPSFADITDALAKLRESGLEVEGSVMYSKGAWHLTLHIKKHESWLSRVLKQIRIDFNISDLFHKQ